MKNKFIFNIQSITDVITNSSSELFVINHNKVDVVEKIIIDFLYSISTVRPYVLDFLNIRNYMDIYEEDDSIIIKSIYDNSIPSIIRDFLRILSE